MALGVLTAARLAAGGALQTGDNLDILPYTCDIYATLPAADFQAGAHKGTIRLGETTGDVVVGGVVT
jgi:hypothetical protein